MKTFMAHILNDYKYHKGASHLASLVSPFHFPETSDEITAKWLQVSDRIWTTFLFGDTAPRKMTRQTARRAVKHQGYQIIRDQSVSEEGSLKLPTTAAHVNHECEVGTNSGNTGTLTDQWPVTWFLGKGVYTERSSSHRPSAQRATVLNGAAHKNVDFWWFTI